MFYSNRLYTAYIVSIYIYIYVQNYIVFPNTFSVYVISSPEDTNRVLPVDSKWTALGHL